MSKILAVMAGGSLGALFRYIISAWVQKIWVTPFPAGTLAVNLGGCFLIGLLSGLFLPPAGLVISPNLRLLILTGFLGAFTTFSTYSLEALNLFRHGEIKLALVSILLSNIAGILLAFGGLLLSRSILSSLR